GRKADLEDRIAKTKARAKVAGESIDSLLDLLVGWDAELKAVKEELGSLETKLDPGSGNGLARDGRFCYSPQTSQGEGRRGGLPWRARRRRWCSANGSRRCCAS